MLRISRQEIFELYSSCDIKILESKKGQPKVIETPQGEIIKFFFYEKKWLSSNTYIPYALRFYKNAERLQRVGLLGPEASSLKSCPELNAYLVQYKKIEGGCVFSLIKNGNSKLLNDVIAYISHLHAKGVFFRGIHLSNLLYQQDGQFALIDIADMKFKTRPLSLYLRYRNLKHLFLNRYDRDFWLPKIKTYLQLYCEQSALSARKIKVLNFLLCP